MLITLVGVDESPSRLASRIITSRSEIISVLRETSIRLFGKMICQPGKDTVVCPLWSRSHQGSWARNMSKGGFFLPPMECIAACVAALDLLTFRLHTESSVNDMD